MKEWKAFLLWIMSAWATVSIAQQSSNPFNSFSFQYKGMNNSAKAGTSFAPPQFGFQTTIAATVPQRQLLYLPANFYAQCLPLTCRMELQLQKVVSAPLVFRLGSKAQVDFLEQKTKQLGIW
jgi:hypothetical protein